GIGRIQVRRSRHGSLPLVAIKGSGTSYIDSVALGKTPCCTRATMLEDRQTFHRKLAFEIPAEAELYEKLKAFQWNASTAIDWSRPIRNFSEEAYMAVAKQISREDFDRL